MERASALLDEVRALEERLLDPEVRRNATAVGALLHPDFVEFGASGRTWDRQAMVAELARQPGEPVDAREFRATRLAADVVLLTYRTGTSLRSSIWCRGEDGAWRIRHHQGTMIGR